MQLQFARLAIAPHLAPTWQEQSADLETHPSYLTHSEKKIDQIESRLGNIEVLLKNIANPAAPIQFHYDPTAAGNTPQTGSSSIPTAASTGDFDSSDDESAYGGDTGLIAHTTFASEFLESAVKRTSLREVNPKMAAGLNNLSQLVEMQKRRSISHGPRFPLQKPVPPGGISKLPMPPMQAVVSLLKHAKGTIPFFLVLFSPRILQARQANTPQAAPPTLFTIMCSLVGLPDFTGLCRRVYFATEEFSDATFIIVNAMLYNLFMEQNSLATDPMARDEYHAYMSQSQANLETALANTHLFLATRVENVQALLLGVCHPPNNHGPWRRLANIFNPGSLCCGCIPPFSRVAFILHGSSALPDWWIPSLGIAQIRPASNSQVKADTLLACLHS